MPLSATIAVGCGASVGSSGFGGIAAALRLRALGWRVTVFERGAMLGGRAHVFARDGFRHDAGPTVITAPFLFDELFELFGRRRADYVEFRMLSPWYRFRFDDGTTFDYGGTIDDTLAEIRKIEPADADGYLRLVEQSRKLFDAGRAVLGEGGREAGEGAERGCVVVSKPTRIAVRFFGAS